MSVNSDMVRFSHAEDGLTRFPPNVEQIRIEHAPGSISWLIARRNDVELWFPLYEEDLHHLAKLLLKFVSRAAA